MRKLPPRVPLDFVAPVHRASITGATLCIFGVAAAIALGVAFDRTLVERNRLDAALAATAKPRHRAPTPQSLKSAAEAKIIESELAVPWSQLLGELEAAAHDRAESISLLHVEPDVAKQVVRITAEVRELPAALDYLERLQKSAVLLHPMLESHERRKDDPQHPLRIKLSAGWRT